MAPPNHVNLPDMAITADQAVVEMETRGLSVRKVEGGWIVHDSDGAVVIRQPAATVAEAVEAASVRLSGRERERLEDRVLQGVQAWGRGVYQIRWAVTGQDELGQPILTWAIIRDGAPVATEEGPVRALLRMVTLP